MELGYFKKLLKNNNAIKMNEEFILFNDLELYSFDTEQSIKFESFEELLKHKIQNETIGALVLRTEAFFNHYNGGRGATGPTALGGGFSHARDRGNPLSEVKFPAEFNVGGKNRSYDKTLELFKKKYASADVEYGVVVDRDGFVHKHIKGSRSSVAISGGKGQVILHNHPGGGNFSDADLISVSSTRENGIVAVGTKKTYSFFKTKNFKSKEFIKAVKKAKWPANLNYDKGADWWLKKNAKTYGYKYSVS